MFGCLTFATARLGLIVYGTTALIEIWEARVLGRIPGRCRVHVLVFLNVQLIFTWSSSVILSVTCTLSSCVLEKFWHFLLSSWQFHRFLHRLNVFSIWNYLNSVVSSLLACWSHSSAHICWFLSFVCAWASRAFRWLSLLSRVRLFQINLFTCLILPSCWWLIWNPIIWIFLYQLRHLVF
jgi:hypothetical protein